MTLEQVPNGERIFVDAHIFIYHFTRLSAECRAFFARCEAGEVKAFTGAHVILEVTHRLMLLEALHKGLISGGQPAKKLKKHPEIVCRLEDYTTSVQQIPRMGVKIRPLTSPILKESEMIRTQYGLLTNDSFLVAAMQKMKLTHIATHNSDLKNIPELTLYQPQDIT
jgi:predicted nucleic acid-binding protein